MESGSADLTAVIQQFASGPGSLVFFWASLAVPSVEMEYELSISLLPEITESLPEFWIYSPRDRIVVENSFDGVVTVARVPVGEDSQSPP
ncbi:hypothetical protein Slu03_29950 [Sediminihabitans luteus]|nr:hypothetical protein Slu03_29950 [Sediminihabitans luteus]